MLRRDLELFEMATRFRLHDEEIWDAMDSMMWVLDAVQMRYRDLAGTCDSRAIYVPSS